MRRTLMLAALMVAVCAAPARAELTLFQSFVGNVGVSSDGFGSTSQAGIISAQVPAGAVVLAAYLYTSTHSFSAGPAVGGGTLAGQPVAYGAPVLNLTACCNLASQRADVTSIIKPLIDGGAGGVYNFAVTETHAGQDGEALVVVYSHASLPTGTVGILDGWASVLGDQTSINFADPLDPTAAGFFAEMRLGIGFSCCSQASTVNVNGTLITANAGNNDDGAQVANGSLITVGGFNDPFSPFLPTYAQDTERYNLVPYIALGDTSITVRTANASRDDNIFLAIFHVAGIAGVNEPPPPPNGDPVPEPATLLLSGLALAAGGYRRYRVRV